MSAISLKVVLFGRLTSKINDRLIYFSVLFLTKWKQAVFKVNILSKLIIVNMLIKLNIYFTIYSMNHISLKGHLIMVFGYASYAL